MSSSSVVLVPAEESPRGFAIMHNEELEFFWVRCGTCKNQVMIAGTDVSAYAVCGCAVTFEVDMKLFIEYYSDRIDASSFCKWICEWTEIPLFTLRVGIKWSE